MKKKLFIIIFLAIELLAISHWVSCANFLGQFSSYDLELRLIADIHNDRGVPLWETRIFHNKVLGTATDIFNLYIKYWSIPFLTHLISPIGALGLFAGFYYWIQMKKKPRILWFLFIFLLAAPFLEIFAVVKGEFLFRVILITLPYVLWSLFGFYYLTKETIKNYYLVLTLLLLSGWYTIAIKQISHFCPL